MEINRKWKSIRIGAYCGLAFSLAAALVILTEKFAPSVREENSKFLACQNDITSECLTELGVELSIKYHSPRVGRHLVSMLAQMGRFNDAFAMGDHILKTAKSKGKDTIDRINRDLASHRLAAAIRGGASLELAIKSTPAVDPLALYFCARDFLDPNFYGFGVSAHPRLTPNDQTRTLVSDIAKMIAAKALNEPGRVDVGALMNAAGLQAVLGDRAKVIELLEQIPRAEGRNLIITKEIVRLIGSETALRLYNKAGGNRPNVLLIAASVEAGSSRSATYLKRAYDEFLEEEPWPAFDDMGRTVKRSADLGLTELALQLARDLAVKVQMQPHMIFPALQHTYAARALLDAAADKSEVRRSLALAIGSHSGPIAWGSSGLDGQRIANIKAQLGDIDGAAQILDGIANPVFAWKATLSSALPIDDLSILLDRAAAVLSVEDYAYLRAQLAVEMIGVDNTQAQTAWALTTSQEILQITRLDGVRAVPTYGSIARVAGRLEKPELERLALTRMGEAALSRRVAHELIRTGFHWHQSQVTP